MRYSIEPTGRILSFAKNIGKTLSNKYSQKFFDSAKRSKTDAIKTSSKRAQAFQRNLQRNYIWKTI